MWSQQTKINILLMLLMAWCWLASWEYRSNMEIFSALQALCAGNSPAIGEIPAQRRVTRSFDVFFDLRLNKQLSKQSWGWWFETPSRPLWRHCNDLVWEHDTADSFYRKISNIRRTLLENKIVDHSDEVGASPVGAAPTTSSFSTWFLASRDSAKRAARGYENLLSVGIWCALY